jgi:pimeloyl-ACP methyl ester carboxylesterase
VYKGIVPGLDYQHELLFLHGRYETHEHWRVLTDRLDFRAKSTFIDLPGFDRSLAMEEKPLSLFDHVDIAVNYILSRDHELVLVGHDLGGAIIQLAALEVELKAPRLLKGLILFNSSSLTHFHCPKWKYFLSREMKKLLRTAGKPLVEHRDKMRSPEITSMRILSESWPDEEKRIQIHWEMRHFKKPVLVLWGNRDEMNPAREVNELVANYPDVELHQEESVGHWPWIEKPEWVLTKVQEFLFKISSGSHWESLPNQLVSQKSFPD